MALLRLPEVMRLSGYSRSMLYSQISQGLYPKPIKIGARAVAWISSEVAAISQARMAGKSIEEIKNLISQLHIARQGCA